LEHDQKFLSLSKNRVATIADFFQFEADFVDSLRCIPMQVRFKLATCGIKLKLTASPESLHQTGNATGGWLAHPPDAIFGNQVQSIWIA